MIIQFYGFHKSKLILIPVSCFKIYNIQWFFFLLHWYGGGFVFITSTVVVIDLSVLESFLNLFSLRVLES